MQLRLIRAYVPSHDPEIELELQGISGVEFVAADERNDHTTIEIVVASESAEDVVALLEGHYGAHDGFRLLLTALEATLPEPQGDEDELETKDTSPINVEELVQRVRTHARLDWIFSISIGIAALVAAIGIVRDSTALIVASMILAPLLGPNMAIATATALANIELARRALIVTAAGVAISLVVGAGMGAIYGVPFEATQVTGRLSVGALDFLIAGTAGVAGALSYTTGAFGRIVGVMIAIALLPPLVLTGMLLGSLKFAEAIAPALVTMINLIAINFVGVVVLFARNVRPRRFYEQERARRAVFIAVAIWALMLVVLVALTIVVNTAA